MFDINAPNVTDLLRYWHEQLYYSKELINFTRLNSEQTDKVLYRGDRLSLSKLQVGSVITREFKMWSFTEQEYIAKHFVEFNKEYIEDDEVVVLYSLISAKTLDVATYGKANTELNESEHLVHGSLMVSSIIKTGDYYIVQVTHLS